MTVKEQLNSWGSQKTPFVFLIDFENQKPLAWKAEDCPDSFKYYFQGHTNHKPTPNKKEPLEIKVIMPSLEDYSLKFQETLSALMRGDTFLMNLTTKGKLISNRSLLALFNEATAKYKIMLEGAFVCFSPETFIQIKDQKINTFPMKGTIDATIPNAEQLLRADLKERAEHATIVDLLRNDMSLVAKNITLKRYQIYEELTAHKKITGQMSSWIQGDLPTNYRSQIGDIIYKMLPAGSISGAPKPKTTALIKDIEKKPRGYYTGISGYFDGDNLDSAVLIRFLEADGSYRCGGGITHKSVLTLEYQELIQKIYVPIF